MKPLSSKRFETLFLAFYFVLGNANNVFLDPNENFFFTLPMELVIGNNSTIGYIVNMNLGFPSQRKGLLLNTIISDLWAVSKNCQLYADEANLTRCPLEDGMGFDSSNSSTFSIIQRFYLNPGYDGNCSCDIAEQVENSFAAAQKTTEICGPDQINNINCPLGGYMVSDKLFAEGSGIGGVSFTIKFGEVTHLSLKSRTMEKILELGGSGILGMDPNSQLAAQLGIKNFTLVLEKLSCHKDNFNSSKEQEATLTPVPAPTSLGSTSASALTPTSASTVVSASTSSSSSSASLIGQNSSIEPDVLSTIKSSITFNGVVAGSFLGDFVKLNNVLSFKKKFWSVNIVGFKTSDGAINMGIFADRISNVFNNGRGNFPLFEAKRPNLNAGIFSLGSEEIRVPNSVFEVLQREYYNDLSDFPLSLSFTFSFLSVEGNYIDVTLNSLDLKNPKTDELLIQSINVTNDHPFQWTFGDLFLQNVVTNFDFETNEVSIARSAVVSCR